MENDWLLNLFAFCATYYQNFGNWALACSRHAMFPNFLRWFCVDRSNGFYDIGKCFLSAKMQRSTNRKDSGV